MMTGPSTPSRQWSRTWASHRRPASSWERRYGVLVLRSDGGDWLYSSATLRRCAGSRPRWMQAHSSAVQLRCCRCTTRRRTSSRSWSCRGCAMMAVGEICGKEPHQRAYRGPSRAPGAACRRGAERSVRALYAVDVVAEEIMTPALVEIGERWHCEFSVAQEHFATAFLRRRLATLFHAYPQPLAGLLALTAAAPAEWHDVGIPPSFLGPAPAWLARSSTWGRTCRRRGWCVRRGTEAGPDLHLGRYTPSGAAGLEPIYRDVMALQAEGRLTRVPLAAPRLIIRNLRSVILG